VVSVFALSVEPDDILNGCRQHPAFQSIYLVEGVPLEYAVSVDLFDSNAGCRQHPAFPITLRRITEDLDHTLIARFVYFIVT